MKPELRQRGDLSFSAGLDSVLQRKDFRAEKERVAYILKLAGLFSKHIILSDTQFIDNPGLRYLFGEPEFREFAYSFTPDGLPPLIVGMREEAHDFQDVLTDTIDVAYRRERPMHFSSLSSQQQQKLEELHKGGNISLDAFYGIIGRNFENYVEGTLTEIYREKGRLYTDRDVRRNYPALVKKQILEIDRFLLDSLRPGCMKIIECIENWRGEVPPTRTDLYREIERLYVTPPLIREIKRVFLDFPYNLNFVWAYQTNLLTGKELTPSLLTNTAPSLLREVQRTIGKRTLFVPEMLIEKPTTAIFLDEIDFRLVTAIRETHEWTKNLEQISGAKDLPEMKKALATHIEFLLARLEESFRHRRDKRHLLYRDDLQSIVAKIGLPVSGGLGAAAGGAALFGLTVLSGGFALAGGLTALVTGLVFLRPPLTREFKQFKSEFAQIQAIYPGGIKNVDS